MGAFGPGARMAAASEPRYELLADSDAGEAPAARAFGPPTRMTRLTVFWVVVAVIGITPKPIRKALYNGGRAGVVRGVELHVPRTERRLRIAPPA